MFGRNKKLNLVIPESFIFVLPLETSISSLPNFSNKTLLSPPQDIFVRFFFIFFLSISFRTRFYGNSYCLKKTIHLPMKIVLLFFPYPFLCYYALLTYKHWFCNQLKEKTKKPLAELKTIANIRSWCI